MTHWLFICGKAKMRSPTAAQITASWPGITTDYAGLSRDADECLSPEQLADADTIFVMDRQQSRRLHNKFEPFLRHKKIITLGIPDTYKFMEPALVSRLSQLLQRYAPTAIDTPYSIEITHIPAVLALIQSSFSYMNARIDPPSSMHRLTAQSLADHPGEVWAIGTPPHACMVLTPQPDTLYLGKLAVSPSHRGRGIARQLIDLARSRARAMGLPSLTLKTRIELTENQATFKALGFTEIARTAHSGFDHPTAITYHLPVPRGAS